MASSKGGDVWSRLEAGNVKMRDPAAVKAKLQAFHKDGPSSLQVITDFDYTASSFVDEAGEQCWTTHRVMEREAALLDPQLGEKLDALKKKYMAIEFDPSLTKEAKVPHMVTWWETAHDLMVKSKFSKANLEHGVKVGNIRLRPGCSASVKAMKSAGIPLVIFSAGIGNIIRWVFDHHADFADGHPDYHLVSNLMEFDEQGLLSGFAPPLVHTFNKNESVVGELGAGLARELGRRRNVLLLGDSLGDCHMDMGTAGDHTALKMAFLNFNVEALLPSYLEAYDVVMVEESTWDLPKALLDLVSQPPTEAVSS